MDAGSSGSAHKAEGLPHYTAGPDLPFSGETLLLYTTATPHTIGAALVVEHKEEGHVHKVQQPV